MSKGVTDATNQTATVWSLPRDAALVVACLLFAAVFVWVIVQSQSFPAPFNKAEVGPGRVPTIAAIGGIISTVIVLFYSARHWLRGRAGASEKGAKIEIRRPLAILGASILIIAWVEATPRVGFYPASAVIVPLFMLLGGERRIWWLILSSIGFVLAMHLGFAMLLDIEFP